MLAMAFPKLKNWILTREAKEFGEETFTFVSSFVENRRKLYKEDQKNDFTDAFLEKINSMTGRGETRSSFYGERGCKCFVKTF